MLECHKARVKIGIRRPVSLFLDRSRSKKEANEDSRLRARGRLGAREIQNTKGRLGNLPYTLQMSGIGYQE